MKDHSELAAAVCRVLATFHLDQQGVTPEEIRAWVVEDMVVVRSRGVFTANEILLCDTEEGRKIVQSCRRELRALTRRHAEAQVAQAVGGEVLRSHCDLDVRHAEMVEVYLFSAPL